MNLLMTCDAVGGVWSYALELARALLPHNVNITLACMGPEPSAAQRVVAREIWNIELHERAYRLEWMDQPWSDVDAAGEWLLELAASSNADVIHLNGYAYAALPWSAPVLITAHSCVFSWWHAVHGCPPPEAEWRRYRQRVSLGVSSANVVVAPTHAMLTALEHHYGIPRAATVIPNARSASQFQPLTKERVIMAAGRLWDPAKNIAAVARAAARVDWPVEIAGETVGHDGSAVELPGVRSLGMLDQAAFARQLGRASIYVHPAFYEPFGLTVLEAALCGCALVLGDVSSLRENWNGAALFVPPNDDVALLDALRLLCADRGMREKLGEFARTRALQFAPERMARAYILEYAQLRAAATRRTVIACSS